MQTGIICNDSGRRKKMPRPELLRYQLEKTGKVSNSFDELVSEYQKCCQNNIQILRIPVYCHYADRFGDGSFYSLCDKAVGGRDVPKGHAACIGGHQTAKYSE